VTRRYRVQSDRSGDTLQVEEVGQERFVAVARPFQLRTQVDLARAATPTAALLHLRSERDNQGRAAWHIRDAESGATLARMRRGDADAWTLEDNAGAVLGRFTSAAPAGALSRWVGGRGVLEVRVGDRMIGTIDHRGQVFGPVAEASLDAPWDARVALAAVVLVARGRAE
jgi:hypothetical protein